MCIHKIKKEVERVLKAQILNLLGESDNYFSIGKVYSVSIILFSEVWELWPTRKLSEG